MVLSDASQEIRINQIEHELRRLHGFSQIFFKINPRIFA